MERDLQIPIGRRKETLKTWFRRTFLLQKIDNPVGMGLVFLVSCSIAFAVSKFGFVSGAMAVAAMIALPTVYCIVAFPRFGIMVFLSLAYLIMWFFKLGVNFPLGTLMDGMEVLFILSLFINQRKKKDWTMFKGPVSVMMLVWIGYNIFQVANPGAASRVAWVYTVRSVAVVMLMYFIFVYYITTKQFIKTIFKLWIGLALFAAIYAFKQEHVGFFPFEEAYLHSDPGIELLLFIGGVWRKFSIFSDPVAFSYNMVTASLVCIGVMTGPIANWKRIILFCLVLFFQLVMLYSGTRGAFVLLPFCMVLLAILKYNKNMLVIVAIAGVFIAGLIFMPTGNQTLNRFQSAFRPSDDASFNLRKMNQKRIQPFILSHPLGGGLGSCGEWGKRFSPGTYLANFAPDSGYVRVAVEMGWIGLLLFCTLMFTIMRTGILNYFKIEDPALRSYCLSAILVIFALNFGNYPQEALVQFPSNVYFYLVVALLVATYRIDKRLTQ